MSSTRMIQQQVESYDDEWKKDHETAMKCRDLEDRLRVGMGLYRFFRGTDELWSRSVQAGREEFDADFVREVHSAYQWWLRPCDAMLDAINRIEKQGYAVEGADEFRQAVLTIKRAVNIDLDGFIEAFRKVAA